MNPRKSRIRGGGVAFGLLLACLLTLPVTAQQVGPDGLVTGVPGADLVRERCTLCHEAGHITRSRLTQGEWNDTIDLMIARGAPIQPGERPIILDYLAKHYGRGN